MSQGADRGLYLSRFTADYIAQLCTLNHINLNGVKTKQDRIESLCALPTLREPVDESHPVNPSPVQPDLGQIFEKLESLRKSETKDLCESLLQAMTVATQSSISSIRVGPELPDFHKLSADDDITCYLSTFERMAVAAEKPKDQWPRLLEPYLTGKAQKAFHALTEEDKKHYDKIVEIILRHYQLTPEVYRLKFRTASKKAEKSFEEFSTRLELYLRRWLVPKEETALSPDFTRMTHLLLIDLFLSSINHDTLRIKLRENRVETVQALARMADDYILHRRAEASFKPQGRPQPTFPAAQSMTNRQQDTKPDITHQNRSPISGAPPRRTGKFEAVCFRCHQLGHRVADCPLPPPSQSSTRQAPTVRQAFDVKQTKSADKTAKPAAESQVNFVRTSKPETDDDRSGLYLIARVNGRDVKALLDTGSAISLIDHTLCADLGLAVTPGSSLGPLTTVDGTEFYTSGIAVDRIEVTGVDVSVSLHQVQTLPVPVLLGRDFARQAKLLIDV